MLQIHIVNFHSKNTMSFVSKKKLQKQTFTYNPIEINSPVTVGLCKQLLAGSSSLQEIFCLVTLSSVVQSCPTLCDPMNCSTPGLPVHHQLPEFTQTHVHRVSDAIQPSHPLLSPSPPAPNPSQHQSLLYLFNYTQMFSSLLY